MAPSTFVVLLVALLAVMMPSLASKKTLPLGQILVPWAKFTENNPKICSGDKGDPCVIPVSSSVLISAADVEVRSLVVYGTLVIRPSANNKKVKVTTGFLIASGPDAVINITAPESATGVTIYLTKKLGKKMYADVPNIPQRDAFTGGRVFGGANGAHIFVEGAQITRHYTLLARHAYSECGLKTCPTPNAPASIFVTDDVTSWSVGSTLVIAPTDEQYGVWTSYLAIRPGAFEGKIVKITATEGVWKIDLDRPIPYYNFNAINPPNSFIDPNGYKREDNPVYYGDPSLRIQAEVFILDRNILFTGDDFSARWAPLAQPPWQNPNNSSKINNGWPSPWSPYANSPFPGEGLHIIMAGYNCSLYLPCSSGGGWIKVRYARVEKAGQRGWVGRYPLHLHRLGDCPTCEFTGNVVYNTQQRGITIHATGNALVQENIVYNMKGAGIYVEEGTEIGNTIKDNVVVCGSGVVSYSVWDENVNNWQIAVPVKNQGVDQGGGSCQLSSLQDFGNPATKLGGCRITGTDNEQADCVQQAGLWALSATNNIIGNRIANNYNCIYFQSTLFSNGRDGTDSKLRVCPLHSNWGIMKGNVCHSHQRFGFYPDVNYPRNLDRSVATHGYVDDLIERPLCMTDFNDDAKWCSCRPVDTNGVDNGQKLTYIEDELDWGNAFVGQYDLADVQYVRYTSLQNNNALYWKGTKMMNMKYDGKFHAHVKNSTFFWDATAYTKIAPWNNINGLYFLNVPGISGTVLLEDIVFRGDAAVAAWVWNPDIRNVGGAGGALGINQQVLLKNVDFSQIKDTGNGAVVLPQETRPTWIKFGAESGNPFLGMVVAFDDSLCGGKMSPCTIRSVVPKYSTHLLNLPGKPCSETLKPYPVFDKVRNKTVDFLPETDEGSWSRRFTNGILCKVQVRRLTIWGQAQGTSANPVDLVIIPPGKTKTDGFKSQWIAFNRAFDASQGDCPWAGKPCCMGTECPADQPRRFAEGYGAAVIPDEYLKPSEPWTIVRADGKAIDTSKITLVEFSDVAFDGTIFPGPDTIKMSLNGVVCTLRSTDPRQFMGEYGPLRRIESGGSCVDKWLKQIPQSSPPPATPYPTKKGATPFPTHKPVSPTSFPSRTKFPTKHNRRSG